MKVIGILIGGIALAHALEYLGAPLTMPGSILLGAVIGTVYLLGKHA